MEYRLANEVREVAEDLIFEHHDELAEKGPRIEYVMTRSTGRSAKPTPSRVRKVSGLNAFLALDEASKPERFGSAGAAQPFFVVEVGEWTWTVLTPEQRKRLVDHLGSHLALDDDAGDWRVEPPEFGEFKEVLERHGFGRPGD